VELTKLSVCVSNIKRKCTNFESDGGEKPKHVVLINLFYIVVVFDGLSSNLVNARS
jgi:hypothetical protein